MAAHLLVAFKLGRWAVGERHDGDIVYLYIMWTLVRYDDIYLNFQNLLCGLTINVPLKLRSFYPECTLSPE